MSSLQQGVYGMCSTCEGVGLRLCVYRISDAVFFGRSRTDERDIPAAPTMCTWAK